MKKHLFLFSFLMVILTGFFTGCTAEAQIELKENGSAQISFKGSAGAAFTKMIQSATGSDQVVFEDAQIAAELSKSGFENVIVSSIKSDLSVQVCDKTCSSFLFTSGLCSKKSGVFSYNFSRQNLSSFYAQADQQIVMILDLLLAPVFNDEQMSKEEYLETLAAFYGQDIADELKTATLKITILNSGKKSSQTFNIADLLTVE